MPKQICYHCFAWLLVALLLITGFIHPATTLAQSTDDEEPNSMVTSYAKTIGISYAEAERRLQLQHEMGSLQLKVIEGEPTYAGSWMKHQPEFGLVVAFAAPNGEEKIRKYLEGIVWADLVEVQQAQYTVGELNDIFAKVNEVAITTESPFASSANYETGNIDLYTHRWKIYVAN